MMMKVPMNIITQTRLWWMRNMVKLIALCHFTMMTVMAMVTMMYVMTVRSMMPMMAMVDLALLDKMLIGSLVSGHQKFRYGLSQLLVLLCTTWLDWKARRTKGSSKNISFATAWEMVQSVDEFTKW